MLPTLTCAGRAFDDRALTAVGEPCGRKFAGTRRPDLTLEERQEQARAGGWSVAGPPMCPRCRRPDPAIARGLAVQGELVAAP